MLRFPAHLLLGVLLAQDHSSVPCAPAILRQEEEPSAEALELARRLEHAGRKERADLLSKLRALAAKEASAGESLERALGARFENAIGTLMHSKTRGSLEALVGRRLALDEARAHALELILDEKRFFYPFVTPDVEPDRARQYGEVRAEVFARIDSVRAIWTERTRITLPAPARDAWEELGWLRTRASELGIDLTPPAEVPAWLLVQNARLDAVTVREIALDSVEAKALDRDRAVLARNEALWAAQPGKGPGVPSLLEREEVRLTNEYRRMMGRHALAWNSRLQEAARMHADYMAATGELGHTEATPGRENPFARMEMLGYAQGVAENCYTGSVVPLAAHDSWLGSSMHHRGILDAHATEMASALSGTFWTQDYGSDRAFEAELGRW